MCMAGLSGLTDVTEFVCHSSNHPFFSYITNKECWRVLCMKEEGGNSC